MQYVKAGQPVTDETVTDRLTAERDEVSLRDFARDLGTQPKSWQREDERSTEPTPEQREAIIAAEREQWEAEQATEAAERERREAAEREQRETAERERLAAERERVEHDPEVVQRVIDKAPPEKIAKAFGDRPDVRKTVARNPRVVREFDRDRQETAKDHLRRHGITPSSDTPKDETGAWIDARAEIVKASMAVRTAFGLLVDVDLDPEIQARLIEDQTRLARWVELFGERVRGESIDEELRNLMESGA